MKERIIILASITFLLLAGCSLFFNEESELEESSDDQSEDLMDEQRFPSAIYRIQQVGSDRYLDAHENSTDDYSTVIRSAESNYSQQWLLTNLGSIFIVKQISSDRFLISGILPQLL